MDSYGWVSLLPPLVAIGLAITTRQVYLALMTGVWFGWTIVNGWNPARGLFYAIEALPDLFVDGERTRIVMVSIMIGALLTFVQLSGGMKAFIEWVATRGLVTTRRSAGVLAWSLGFFIFVESVIGVLVSGTITRPLFDRFRASREKLAYVLDSTCAPKAILLPLNTWGAYVIGLLIAQDIESPVRVMLHAVPLNVYAILAVALALFVVSKDWNIGAMREAERRVRDEGKLMRDGAEPLVAGEALQIEAKRGVEPKLVNMVLPVATVVTALPIVLFVTGNGNLMEGSGTLAAFWAILSALALSGLAYRVQGVLTLNEIVDAFMKGVGALVPVGVLLMLAFAIGDVCRDLGTGVYVARLAEGDVPASLVPAALFALSGFIAFATGTSFGTWAIMVPIAVPMAALMELNTSLTVAAVLGGGIFGDHCSPISDSTIVSSMAACTDHIDHVRTQLPYALIAAAMSAGIYLVLGLTL
jgi:Na+/H+ antiporter NhaC